MNPRCRLASISAFLLVCSLCSPAVAQERGLGARPPTPAEQAYIDAVYTKVRSVAPNDLARARAAAEIEAARLEGKVSAASESLPTGIDNSTLAYFPLIRSQGSQGSCTCWAAGYYYDTFTQAADEGYDVSGGDNDHICSPAFLYPLVNGGYDGGANTQYVMTRLNDIGCSSWSLKPYSSDDWTSWPSEAAWVDALDNRTQAAHWIDGSTESGLDAIKQHLANGNLAVTDFDVYSTWYDYYPDDSRTGLDNDVYYYADGEMVGGHAVTLVGYDDTRSYVDHRDGQTHTGAFLIANSWGPWWGVTNNTGTGTLGFFWVAYGMFLDSTFGPWVYYNDDRPDYRPSLYAVAGINHAQRYDVRLRGGVTCDGDWYSHDVIYYDGGEFPVSDAKRIAIDLTDGVAAVGDTDPVMVSAQLYVWGDSMSAGTITSADFFDDSDGDGSYFMYSYDGATVTVDPGMWGFAYATIVHGFSVTALDPDPPTVLSRGVTSLAATYADSEGRSVASWGWSDGGRGGIFSPSNAVQNPTYTAPINDGYEDLVVTLTVTATTEGPDAVSASDSTTLTVLSSRIRFEDIGTTANLPSTIGAAWGDYDDDGYPDLYVGGLWGNHRAYLLHNDGDGTFTDVTVAMGLRVDGSSWEDWGCAWGDYNNDGALDLLVAGGNHPLFLYRNDGSTFTDVGGETAGMPYFPTSRGVAWGDYDGDGWLDLYVCYEQSNVSRLYRNDRDGTFTEVTNEAGMEFIQAGLGSQCSWVDHNNDGLLDLSVARIQQATGAASQPRLYTSNGDGTFTDLALASGITGHSTEGVAWGDYDNDGFLDLYLGGNQNRASYLYHNNGDGSFTNVYDEAMDAGAGALGVAWADYDNDGFLDLAQGNGKLPQYNESGPSNPFLFHNNRNGTFTQVAASAGVTAQRRYRTTSWADFNLDGHIDLFMAGEDGYSCLYENAGTPSDGNWLRVRTLTDRDGDATDGNTAEDRDALGARVEVNLDNDATFPRDRTLVRVIDGGSGFMGQNEQVAQFGLGSADVVAVRVAFPDGTLVTESDVAVNQQIAVRDEAQRLGTVSGVVTEYVSGAPVAGAFVACAHLTTMTDYGGEYDIGRVPVLADVVVRAWSPEYECRTITGISTSASVVTTVDVSVIPAGFGVIEGRVIDAGTLAPIAGATVSCGTPTTTDANGEYVFYVAVGSGYTVSASAPDYVTGRHRHVALAGGDILTLDFALEPMEYGSIGGTVLEAGTQRAIEGVVVRASYVSDPYAQLETHFETTTAADGTYLVPTVPTDDAYRVEVTTAGYEEWEQTPIVVAADAVTQVDVVLTPRFDDVPSDWWAFEDIGACVAAGIVGGYGDGLYHPDWPLCRDQMAVFIARAVAGGDSNVPGFTGEPTFADVGTGHWVLRYVEYAVSCNIVGGYGDDLYHPEYSVDRGQMAVFVARSMADPTGDGGLAAYTPPATPTFPDVATDFWSYRYIEYIADPERAVVGGYWDGLYHPEIFVSRDQMAVYIAKAFGLGS